MAKAKPKPRNPWDSIEKEFGVRDTDDETLQCWHRMCASARKHWQVRNLQTYHHYNDLCGDIEKVLKDRGSAEDMAQ